MLLKKIYVQFVIAQVRKLGCLRGAVNNQTGLDEKDLAGCGEWI